MQNAMWFALIGISIVGLMVATFHAGGEWRSSHYWVPAVAQRTDTVTPARFSVETNPSTGVIDLPPIELSYVSSGNTAVIDLPDFVPSLDVPVLTGMVMTVVSPEQQLTNALAEIARLNEALQVTDAQLTREQQLHRKWVRFAHIARSRYRQAIVLGWEQPRRETRAKVLAEVIPIGTIAHPENVRFLMPTIRHDWIDRELVAA